MPIILLKELLFVEDFKSQAKKFESGGVSKDIVTHYIAQRKNFLYLYLQAYIRWI